MVTVSGAASQQNVASAINAPHLAAVSFLAIV
jgi:hypothetical protein